MVLTEVYTLPSHWAGALINGDDSGLDAEDIAALEAFESDMIRQYGSCWCLSVGDDEVGDFRRYHDATHYGVLACDVLDFVFDVARR
jgi:hypothetical protein